MKTLSFTTAVLFVVSAVFPVAAGLAHDTSSFPRWWGTLDVTLAFLLVLFVFAFAVAARNSVTEPVEHATYRIYRILHHGILAMCAVFFLAGDRIVWAQCLTGFAWRAWLLLYCLPCWVAAFTQHSTQRLTSDERPP